MAALDARHSDARLERLMRPHAHPEEWLSIIFALGGALLRLAFIYVFFQMLFLLVSATQIRVLGVLYSILSIVPSLSLDRHAHSARARPSSGLFSARCSL